MKNKYLYTPTTFNPQSGAEFHRIREWWNCFHATLSAALGHTYPPYTAEELADAKREARRVANSVHGSIRKQPKQTQPLSTADDRARWNAFLRTY